MSALPVPTPFDPVKTTGQFQASLQSLANFDRIEVKAVIDTLIAPSNREKCFIATYLRASANVGTLLDLEHPKHFQAINMLTRAMFELAVDIRLIDVITNGSEKMLAFVDVEKLRSARKILKFHSKKPLTKADPAIYASFVTAEGARIDALQAHLWPGTKTKDLKHWSAKNLPERVTLLNGPFEELYVLTYPHLSWLVHAGLTGVINLKSETFTTMCGYAFILAADGYREILQAMIEVFKIAKAVPNIDKRMRVARLLPFTETQEQVNQLMASLEP
jgi:hypothetical protein